MISPGTQHGRGRRSWSRRLAVALAVVVALAGLAGCLPPPADTGPLPADDGGYRSGQDVVRGFDLTNAGDGGYLLDGDGLVTGRGRALPLVGAPRFSSDIARSLAVTVDGTFDHATSGYVLDGYGTLHPFGTNPGPMAAHDTWPGWDIARDLDLLPGPGNKGLLLDGFGGLHPLNGAVVDTTGAPYWPGDDRARGVALLPDGSGGYLMDTWGQLFAFGQAPVPVSEPDDFALPLARGVRLDPGPSPLGGWIMDAWGGAHRFQLRPPLQVETVVTGLDIPWDVAFTPDGHQVFDERNGKVWARDPDGTVHQLASIEGEFENDTTEGGLNGLVVDPRFATNRRLLACQSHQDEGPGGALDIRVVPLTVAPDWSSATVGAPLLAGLDNETGFHVGCRLAFGADGALWVSIGDTGSATGPQDLTSSAGKILRVDADTGAGLPGNPFAGSGDAMTRRIWSWGHRNPQGLALRPGTDQMWSCEHGPDRDDEVNDGRSGNAGWNPNDGTGAYDQNVPMTDTAAYPDALVPAWQSGKPTLAPGDIAWLSGSQWGGWQGAMAMVTLKSSQMRVGFVGPDGHISFTVVPGFLGDYGRLRSVAEAPDGSLWVTTGNGGGTDRILRITPG